MNKIMDVNPFKIHNGGMEEVREPRFKRLRSACSACCPTTLKSWIIFILVLVIAWQFLVSWGVMPSLTFPAVESNKWQAVFLTSGQVYFGHLKELNMDYVKLSNVYYLKVSQQLQPATAKTTADQQQQLSLVKLGDEIHGPENEMFIPKTQIIFWENMKADSSVVLAIQQVESEKK